MTKSYDFLKLLIDSITEHIAVIDRDGKILFVNRAWVLFARENGSLTTEEWVGVDYLKECENSADRGDALGKEVAEGIRKVIRTELELFYFEYPCHSPDKKRWFMMRVTPFTLEGSTYYVISHQNITERKLAEEKVLNLSRIDGLTNLPNRRFFDQFLAEEWRRCARLNLPVTLAMVDIDHFKLLNDRYGHLAGDECLQKIGIILNDLGNRPGDLFARYGGEEFALVFGNTTTEQALVLIHKMLEAIDALKIPNENSPVKPTVTVSIGLATVYPDAKSSEQELIRAADTLLYAAKRDGRGRVFTTRRKDLPHANSSAAYKTI